MPRSSWPTAIASAATVLLASCVPVQEGPAPLQVIDVGQIPDILLDADAPIQRPPIHVVARGETLGEIALAYGLSYRDLALWNTLANPNLIEVGQRLRLSAPQGQAQVVPPETKPRWQAHRRRH